MNATPPPPERTFAALLSNIVDNLQDIVRSEIRLVKAEAREQLGAFARRSVWLVAGVVCSLLALCFALWSAFFALLRTMPDWAAALVIAAGLAVIAVVSTLVFWRKTRALSKAEFSPRSPVHKERFS